MFVRCFAGTVIGIDATIVSVEVNLATGGLGLFLVGLPDSAVKESLERIRSSFENEGLRWISRKMTVNLAPADIKKEGAAFDLPIAIGILAATGQVNGDFLEQTLILGELSLDGSLRGISGVLPIVMEASSKGFKRVILPEENAMEAAITQGVEVVGAKSLGEVVRMLNGEDEFAVTQPIIYDSVQSESQHLYSEDFSDVKGQQQAKRALEIAAAGGHNVIMVGAPGSGKTMLARRLPSILPPLSLEEAVESTKIHSVAGKLGVRHGVMRTRPFRAPHHLVSQVALIGGGQSPQPGEVSLSHNGVLFLDELPEFGRNTLEVLRQPLEDRVITISRAKYSVEYPANFTLIASMNPCPCGYHNHPTRDCGCSPAAVVRYRGRISGPLMDRIDLHIEIVPVSLEEISQSTPSESSADVRARVVAARAIQAKRFEGVEGVYTNSMMNSKMLRQHCPLSVQARKMLELAMGRLNLSARAYDRIIKVARTIADLDGRVDISTRDISEAIGYRTLDREG